MRAYVVAAAAPSFAAMKIKQRLDGALLKTGAPSTSATPIHNLLKRNLR
jgi:hypothetical protein